jgi:hypothetical protein
MTYFRRTLRLLPRFQASADRQFLTYLADLGL